ncbi:MAG: hypothetical protein KDK36_00995 [Leptospiraceae bacterium]|nr:hypothetical protein [Leptospiraceae bacterium]
MDNLKIEKIQYLLNNIHSLQPFQILFYGSRQRKDHNENSDYNFFMIASAQDQIRTGFITEVTEILESENKDATVTLITGDKDSIIYRMSIFEPTAVHLMELSEPIYGHKEFESLQTKWEECKKKGNDTRELIRYLENRSKFYRNINSKTTKDDISRIEKILSLNIQSWVLEVVDDISITEIAFLDIPSRITKLVKYLYKHQIPDDIHLLTSIYEEVHELKRSMRLLLDSTEGKLDKLKDSITFIKDLSKEIEKIV